MPNRVPRNNNYPSWDQTFMNHVALLAQRSHCRHHKVGGLLVSPTHREISSGYNGPAPGKPHCDDPKEGCNKQKLPPLPCIGLHAEDNAIGYVEGSLVERLKDATYF